MRKYILLIIPIVAMLLASCESVNDERIPPASVNIEISEALWPIYGVHGYGDFRYFIRQERIPSDFAYTALTYTGFGGVLLLSGASNGNYNVPLAFDLACPVESRHDPRVIIDKSSLEAYCPKCKSRYDVYEGNGRPISGEALNRNYGMTQYRVILTSSNGYVIVR